VIAKFGFEFDLYKSRKTIRPNKNAIISLVALVLIKLIYSILDSIVSTRETERYSNYFKSVYAFNEIPSLYVNVLLKVTNIMHDVPNGNYKGE
jgi:hypothetical protein